jgi:hypothetical protein
VLTVCCYKWGTLFSASHVNALRAGLEAHLHLDHRLVCVTDDAVGIDGDVSIVPMPELFSATPRCRRRMYQWSQEFDAQIGARRKLAIDLDVVIVDDITPIVDRPEPICCWRVSHAGVYSGSFVLADAGALDGAWQEFKHDPDGYPVKAQARGISSDQAMLNYFLKGKSVATWTERDGFVSFYGRGYERLEHFGVGPTRRHLPACARVVVLGSADLAVLEDASYPWVRDHYLPLVPT